MFYLHISFILFYNIYYGIEEDFMSEPLLIRDKHIKLAIALKTSQLKREELSSLTCEHVESALMGLKWSQQYPKSVHEAIDDIFKLSANEVVQYLSSQAVIVGSQMKLNEFHDLIGGGKE